MPKTSVLVVEDEYIVAKDVETRLTTLGYSVVGVVASGEEAVEHVALRPPDIVLMDIMLKGEMDGIAAAERVREIGDVPVVFLTAFTDEQTLRRAQVTEAFGYLLKPFEERELHITIEMALYKHRMESRLRESQERLSTTLRSIGDAVIATDPRGRITFMNTVAETLTGWRDQDAQQRLLWEVFQVEGGSIRSQLEQMLRDPAAPVQVLPIGEESVLHMRNGKSIPIDDSASLIRDEKGRPTGAVVVFRDISERKHAESALRQKEEQYRAFFEEDLTGDYIASADGRILECNPAFLRILGLPSQSVALRSNIHQFYPDTRARDIFLSYLRSHKRLTYYEKELKSTDGRRVHVIENAIGEFDGKGTLLRYKGYMFDDSIRKRLEEQLYQSQKMESIGTLASGIAHDFNNIINNVLGFATLLQKHTDDPLKIQKYAQTIEKSALRGAELSTQLLSFARVGQRERHPLQVDQVIDEVIALCGETFPKSIVLEKHVEPGIRPVLGEHGGVYQVLLNLCVNARDAIQARQDHSGGKLRIEARNITAGGELSARLIGGEGTPCVEVKVTDNGTGIPREIRERIFDPFFTTKERGKGTGLGLSVVYSIVRNHHGVLLVDSEEGKGTTFRVVFPTIEGIAEQQSASDAEAAQEGRNEVVLVVDDEETMQELARALLEEAGYQVLTARSGAEAIEIYRERRTEIDVVVLDLVMPGMDGGQTYLKLKAIDPDIRAFICTGYMPERLVGSLLEKENLRSIQKPFQPEALIRLVRETLDRKAVHT